MSRPVLGAVVATASAAALCLGAAATASANTIPLFGAPTALSGPALPGHYAIAPLVDANTRGDEVAAWTLQDPREQRTGWVAFRAGGGAWSAKQPLPTVTGPGASLEPDAVVLNETGGVTFAGRAGDGVAVVSRTAAGWGTPQVFVPPAGTAYDAPSFAANEAGDQVIAWRARTLLSGRPDRVFVTRRQGSAAFAAPKVYAAEYARTIDVAVNDRGDASLVWGSIGTAADPGGVSLATAPSGEPFGAASRVSPASRYLDAGEVVVTTLGDTFVAWRELVTREGLDTEDIVLRRRTKGGTLGAIQRLGSRGAVIRDGIQPVPVRLTSDRAGVATVVWQEADRSGTNVSLRAASALPNRLVGPTTTVATLPQVWSGVGSVETDASGGVLVAWHTGSHAFLAWRPAPGAAFEAPTPIAPVGTARNTASLAVALVGPGQVSAVTSRYIASAPGAETEIVARRSTLTAGPAPDITPPVVSSATVTQAPTAAGGTSLGFAFTLTGEAAKVTAELTQTRAGIWSNGACALAPSGGLPPGATGCNKTVYVTPSPTAWLSPGARRLAFATAPAPGDYLLTLTAKDAAGNAGYAAQYVTVR